MCSLLHENTDVLPPLLHLRCCVSLISARNVPSHSKVRSYSILRLQTPYHYDHRLYCTSLSFDLIIFLVSFNGISGIILYVEYFHLEYLYFPSISLFPKRVGYKQYWLRQHEYDLRLQLRRTSMLFQRGRLITKAKITFFCHLRIDKLARSVDTIMCCMSFSSRFTVFSTIQQGS